MKKSFFNLTMLLIFCISMISNLSDAQPVPIIDKMVLISTNYGEIKIKLYNETPKHRDNFIKLATKGFYDGTVFHRIIKGFMVQGGDPNSKDASPEQALGMGGPGYTIPAELNSKCFHKKGALAAARLGDEINPKKESSGSQFYIVQGKKYAQADMVGMGITSPEAIKAYTTVGGTPFLDGNYTVFGEVVEGLDVVDKIAAVKTGKNDRPVEDIKITVKVIN